MARGGRTKAWNFKLFDIPHCGFSAPYCAQEMNKMVKKSKK